MYISIIIEARHCALLDGTSPSLLSIVILPSPGFVGDLHDAFLGERERKGNQGLRGGFIYYRFKASSYMHEVGLS